MIDRKYHIDGKWVTLTYRAAIAELLPFYGHAAPGVIRDLLAGETIHSDVAEYRATPQEVT